MSAEHIAVAMLLGAVAVMFALIAREIRKANKLYDESMRKRREK